MATRMPAGVAIGDSIRALSSGGIHGNAGDIASDPVATGSIVSTTVAVITVKSLQTYCIILYMKSNMNRAWPTRTNENEYSMLIRFTFQANRFRNLATTRDFKTRKSGVSGIQSEASSYCNSLIDLLCRGV